MGQPNPWTTLCSLCPSALPTVSVWRCCHDPLAFDGHILKAVQQGAEPMRPIRRDPCPRVLDPRAFDDCAAALEDAAAAVDKRRRTKFFLATFAGFG